MSHRKRPVRTGLLTFTVAAMLFAGCGSTKKETSSSATTGGSGTTVAGGGKKVKLALIAPLSGSLAPLGLGMRNAMKLAIDQANAAGTVPGWTIEFDPEDDTAKADVGGQVASKVSSDADVAGVVGTLNSSVAQQTIPILDNKNIAQISPANTNPSLTQGDDPANQKRPHPNYFRVCTTDAIQGPFAADFVFDTLGKKKVAIVHDNKTYGKGLTDAFAAEFKKKGGTVVTTEIITPGDQDFSGVVTKIKPLAPELIYYGGEFPEASLLSKQAKAGGLNVPLMGGDGIVDGKYIETGGTSVEGDFATNVGAPAEQLDSAKKFISDYDAAKFGEGFSAYGPYAFDAANVLIQALAKVLPSKSKIDDATRKEIIAAVQATNINGVTGKITFDQFGDTTTKVLTVYKVSSGKFAPEKTADFSG